MLERWEHYEDGGTGIGVRGFGDSESDAFEQAALALTAAVTDLGSVAARERVLLCCEAPSEGLLLAAWLDTVRRRMKSGRMLFPRFEVLIDGPRLSAHACDGWIAQAIMDF